LIEMKLSIIIPTYNEEFTIKKLINVVMSVEYPIDYEIIIVDDASIDRTYEKELLMKLRDPSGKIRIYKNRVNRGKGASIRKGLKMAHGDIIVIQDGDTEYDPHDIPKLIEPIIKNESDAVFGSRFLHSPFPRGMALPNFIANKILTFVTNILFSANLTDMMTCYKIVRADVIKSIRLRANRFTFEPEITALLLKKGLKITELPIDYHGRTSKEGKKIQAKDFLFTITVLFWQRLKQAP